jgi:hypothetical protein
MFPYTEIYLQDTQPTARKPGALWITEKFVKIAQKVDPQVWVYVNGDVPRVVELGPITVLKSQFTDGGAAVGTYVTPGIVPKNAVLIGSKVIVNVAFDGDTSAVLIIGDGSDTDRYMSGTPSVFAAAPNGIETGVPSGAKLLAAANSPTLTVTSGADFTNVAAAGSLTYSIYYLITA